MKLTEVCIQQAGPRLDADGGDDPLRRSSPPRASASARCPDVDFPTITVSVTLGGRGARGHRERRRRAARGGAGPGRGRASRSPRPRARAAASVTVELDLARDVDLALQDVQAKVAQAQRSLPRDVDPPVISKTNPEDQPIMWVGLSGPFPPPGARRLRALPGQGAAADGRPASARSPMGGYLERNVRIWLDAAAARRARADGRPTSSRALQREHVELPAGRIETEGREVNVRVLGEALDLDDAARASSCATSAGAPGLPRGRRAGRGRLRGRAPHRRASTASRRRVWASASSAARTRSRWRTACAPSSTRSRRRCPRAWSSAINFDSTRFIEESVHEIELELVLAVLLTALVCWLFLGSLSSTLNVVLAIPMSLLGTVAVIYFLGFTLNTFTLLGAVARGRHRRRRRDHGAGEHLPPRRDGQGPGDARRARAPQEITFAALAATLAVVAIFLPVVFMKGVIGKFFLQFGVTLCARGAALLRRGDHARAGALRADPRRPRARSAARLGRGGRPRASTRLERALRARAGARRCARAVLGAASGGAGALRASLLVLLRALPERVRAVAGPEPPHGAAADRGRLRPRRRPTGSSSAAEAFVMQRGPRSSASSRVVGGFGGGGVNTGDHLRHAGAAGASARSTQAEFAARAAQGAQRRSRACAPWCRTSRSRASPRSAASRSSSRCAAPTGSSSSTTSQRADGASCAASGLVVDLDTDYQLGMPELRVAARPRARRRPRRLDRGRRDDAQRARRRRARRQVQRRRAAHRRARCACSPTSARGPRTSRACSVRTGTGELVPLSALVTHRGAPGAAGDHPPRPRARDHGLRQRRARPLAGRGARQASSSSAQDCPVGTRVVLGGASVAFRESMASLLFALFLGILVAYMVLGVAVQLVPAPDHGAHDPAALARGRGVRALDRRQERSTSSA